MSYRYVLSLFWHEIGIYGVKSTAKQRLKQQQKQRAIHLERVRFCWIRFIYCDTVVVDLKAIVGARNGKYRTNNNSESAHTKECMSKMNSPFTRDGNLQIFTYNVCMQFILLKKEFPSCVRQIVNCP